jgi:hypothetical protein
MSRPAHATAVSAFDNRAKPPLMTAMLDTIQELLDGAPAPTLDSLEEPLTTGYAHALALEGERLRLERELRSLIRTPSVAPRERKAGVERLETRLATIDGDLRALRSKLATLRRHVAEPRS